MEEKRQRSHFKKAVGTIFPQRRRPSKEEKGEAEAIKSTLMGCLIGEITGGSPNLEEVQQGIWQKLSAGDVRDVGAQQWQFLHSGTHNGLIHTDHGIDAKN